MIPFHDIAASAVCGVSIPPGTTASNSGGWVDMSKSVGNVGGIVPLGSATGSPTSYLVNAKIQEADDNSGTNAQDITGATGALADAAPGTNDKQAVMISPGQRSKRWCRIVSTVTHTGGTTPTLPHAGVLLAMKQRV